MCFCLVIVNVSMCIFLNQHSLTNGFVSLVRKITISLYNYFLEFARKALSKGRFGSLGLMYGTD